MQAKYDRRQMVRLICEGLNSYQIAARVHVTPSTVRKATRQLKQQQAGTYKPRGREFYSERLIDLIPKTTKIDDAKSATVKANRRELIKEAIEKRRLARGRGRIRGLRRAPRARASALRLRMARFCVVARGTERNEPAPASTNRGTTAARLAWGEGGGRVAGDDAISPRRPLLSFRARRATTASEGVGGE